MSGVVFHHISEGIMAQDLKLSVADARDSLSVLLPDVKNGNILAADYVLSRLGVKTNENWSGSYANGNPIWGTTSHQDNQVKLTKVDNVKAGLMPDVTGMGARDAVYLLESKEVKVRIEGRGKVVSQSLPAGHQIKKGEVCSLKLN